MLPQLNTAKKIKIAKVIYHILHFFRAMVSKSDTVIVKRNNINYKLELFQGISLAFYLGLYERESFRRVSLLLGKDGVAIDVGANIGLFSLHMANIVGGEGKIYAFEPTGSAFQRLMVNKQLNPEFDQIISCYQAYINDTGQPIKDERFYSSWQLNQGNAGKHPKHFGDIQDASGADALTLDDFADLNKNELSRVDLIKIDVDGYELMVLNGAKKLIKKYKPFILCEVSSHTFKEHGYSLNDFIDIVNELDYCIYNEKNMKKIQKDSEILEKIIPFEGSINVVLKPCQL